MRKLFFILALLPLSSAYANDGKTIIRELTPSFAFSKPGLYEVISPYTGNVIYVFREQGGNIHIQAVQPVREKK